MVAIHTKGELSPLYFDSFIPTLRDNCLRGMKGLLTFFEEVDEKVPGMTAEEITIIKNSTDLTPEIAKLIARIWRNKEFQELSSKADDAQVQGGKHSDLQITKFQRNYDRILVSFVLS